MMIKITKLNESYLKITGIEFDDAKFINDNFSFFAENYRWNPKFKKKQWDGKIRLFNLRNATLPFGCLAKLINLFNNAGFEYELDSELKNVGLNVSEKDITDFINEELACDMTLRDYQLAGVIAALKMGKCITVLPTASGKSFCQFTIVNYLLKKEYCEKILLIVPTLSLVDQMQYDFLDYGKNIKNYKDNIHTIYSGKSKQSNAQIYISTWQSLLDIEPEYFEQFDCVLVDEAHLSTGKSITTILHACVNSKFRFGVSGTLQDSKVAKTQLESVIGEIVESVDTKQLIENGTLTPIKIYNLVIKYNKEQQKKFTDILKANKEEIKLNAAKKYKLEMDFLSSSKERKKIILNTTNRCDGNTLILFKNISYGKELVKLLDKYTERNVYFIYGDISADERERVRLIMEEESNAIIVATLNIFSTGINIKKLKYLIFAQTIKSKIKVLQSIGRVLRKHDSKDEAVLIDIVDNINDKNFAYKHAVDKLDLYDSEGFKYKIKEINL